MPDQPLGPRLVAPSASRSASVSTNTAAANAAGGSASSRGAAQTASPSSAAATSAHAVAAGSQRPTNGGNGSPSSRPSWRASHSPAATVTAITRERRDAAPPRRRAAVMTAPPGAPAFARGQIRLPSSRDGPPRPRRRDARLRGAGRRLRLGAARRAPARGRAGLLAAADARRPPAGSSPSATGPRGSPPTPPPGASRSACATPRSSRCSTAPTARVVRRVPLPAAPRHLAARRRPRARPGRGRRRARPRPLRRRREHERADRPRAARRGRAGGRDVRRRRVREPAHRARAATARAADPDRARSPAASRRSVDGGIAVVAVRGRVVELFDARDRASGPTARPPGSGRRTPSPTAEPPVRRRHRGRRAARLPDCARARAHPPRHAARLARTGSRSTTAGTACS